MSTGWGGRVSAFTEVPGSGHWGIGKSVKRWAPKEGEENRVS